MELTMQENNLQMFHININCTNLDRSLAFYKAIGFRVLNDFANDKGSCEHGLELGAQNANLPRILGVDPASLDRAVMLQLGDNPRATRLDLKEWRKPITAGRPPGMTNTGMARLCFKVKDCLAAFRAVKSVDGECISEPLLIPFAGTKQKVFCCYDPDRTILEFIEFVKS